MRMRIHHSVSWKGGRGVVLIRIPTDRMALGIKCPSTGSKGSRRYLHKRVKPITDTASSETNKNNLLSGMFCSWGCVK